MLRRIVTCIRPNQKNQPNLDLCPVQRYTICHFPIVVFYLCIGQNQKNQPYLVLYLVRRYKIFVSVATLEMCLQNQYAQICKWCELFLEINLNIRGHCERETIDKCSARRITLHEIRNTRSRAQSIIWRPNTYL